jgi:hypothetical protein
VVFVEALIEVLLAVDLGADEQAYHQKFAQSRRMKRVMGAQQLTRLRQAVTPVSDTVLTVGTAVPSPLAPARIRVTSGTKGVAAQRRQNASRPSDVLYDPSPRRRVPHPHLDAASDSQPPRGRAATKAASPSDILTTPLPKRRPAPTGMPSGIAAQRCLDSDTPSPRRRAASSTAHAGTGTQLRLDTVLAPRLNDVLRLPSPRRRAATALAP